MADVRGRTVAVLATDGVEQVELTEPVKALKQAGTKWWWFLPRGVKFKA